MENTKKVIWKVLSLHFIYASHRPGFPFFPDAGIRPQLLRVDVTEPESKFKPTLLSTPALRYCFPASSLLPRTHIVLKINIAKYQPHGLLTLTSGWSGTDPSPE